MARLAPAFGMSDTYMARLCRKYRIPKPPRGYWAKLLAGQSPPKAPLPPPLPEDSGFVLRSVSHPALAQVTEKTRLHIPVPESLRSPHPLTARARYELKGASKGEHGLLAKPEQAAFDLCVSTTQLRRALLLIDTVLKAIVRQGHAVSPGPVATINGVVIAFGVHEVLDQIREQPAEHDLTGRYEFGHSRFIYRYVPSGRLRLFIEPTGHGCGHCWGHASRWSWREGKKQRLEDCVGQFVNRLIEIAESEASIGGARV